MQFGWVVDFIPQFWAAKTLQELLGEEWAGWGEKETARILHGPVASSSPLHPPAPSSRMPGQSNGAPQVLTDARIKKGSRIYLCPFSADSLWLISPFRT